MQDLAHFKWPSLDDTRRRFAAELAPLPDRELGRRLVRNVIARSLLKLQQKRGTSGAARRRERT